MHIVQGFAGAVIDICIEQQLHTRSLCSRIEFFKFPIVIDSGTVNFSYMLYYVTFATVYKGNIIKNLIMDCQSYTKYRPNETTGGIFVSWRRKEELPTGA